MPTALSRKTIMVVEDDIAILDVLADALREEGYIVLSARDGEHALEMLTSLTPDLICLDYHLPGIFGPPLIKAICEHITALCPIVLLTAIPHVPSELREATQGVIKKPFNIVNLFDTIESLLRP